MPFDDDLNSDFQVQVVPLEVNERTQNGLKRKLNHVIPKKNSRIRVNPHDVQSWELTLEKAIKAIVSIKANGVRTFDTEKSGKS